MIADRGVRVALVTGAAQGIGAEIAVALAAAGYAVGLTSRQGLGATAEAVGRTGAACFTKQLDFQEPGAASAFVAEASSVLGAVDVLVNNAGLTMDRPFEQTDAHDVGRLMSINLMATFDATRAAVAPMRARGGGSVINISSIHAGFGMTGHAAYAATKGAMDALTRQLAVELGPDAIRVNAIAPGLIEVPRITGSSWYDAEQAAEGIPLRRSGVPQDVANLTLFLASDKSNYLTGAIIRLDGGLSAKMAIQL